VTQYEHRVGRTGRAGKTGEALLLLANDESRLLPLLAGMVTFYKPCSLEM
jgi:superfamily II DNA/RNA helicase